MIHYVNITDGSEITEFFWATGEPNNQQSNEDRIQLRQNADYKWNDNSGGDILEASDGWSVNKYICQCK